MGKTFFEGVFFRSAAILGAQNFNKLVEREKKIPVCQHEHCHKERGDSYLFQNMNYM